VNRKLLLGLLNHISVISIIQGAALAAKGAEPPIAAKAASTGPSNLVYGQETAPSGWDI
jgi:hypothetical protein